MSFRAILTRLRTVRGLSQYALAKRAGVAQQYLNELEAGKKASPGVQTVRKLAKALEVPVEDLVKTTHDAEKERQAMRPYDVYFYPEARRWHFVILAVGAGASSVKFNSQAENRSGYVTKDQARQAARLKRAQLPSRYLG